MDFKHLPLDLPVSKSKDMGEGRVIYSFKKDDHAKLLLKNLTAMQANQGMLTDLVVRTKSKDREEPFHSILLAACSPVIKQSLTGKHFDCTAGVISLGDLTPNLLEAFRDFLYKSELPLDQGMVNGLQRFAIRYSMDSLGQLCGQRKDQRKADEGMAVWSKHHEDVLSQLHDMFEKTQLTTMFLEDSEGSTQYAVHGALIAAASPVLQGILSNELLAQEGTTYRLKEVTFNTLGDLIEYIYTGEVTLEGESVASLLSASCRYEIPALARACCDWLSLELNSYNVLGLWWLARYANCEYTSDLEGEAKSYILANFTSICEEAEFLELEYEDLKEIIQDDNLCVGGEEDVFSAVVNWVEADEEGRSSYFCNLLPFVRMENTSFVFLQNVERNPLVRNCTRCLQAVQSAQAKLLSQAPMEQRAFDGDERRFFLSSNIPEVEPRRYDDDDIKRMLLQEFLDSQSKLPTLRSTHDSDDELKELSKQSPRRGQRKGGEPDMRFSVNRRRLGLQNKDGSPDKRFKVNKKHLGLSSQGNVTKPKSQKGVTASQNVGGPLKKDGSPDMRFKVNKETLPSKKSAKASKSGSGPIKKDGTPDLRYAVNKTPSPVGSSRPVKQDGTPDMRFAVNKPPRRPASSQTSSSLPQSPSYAGPVKKDGTPDMRYTANKQVTSTPSSSGYAASSMSQLSLYNTSSGPLKRDGTPDMRYSANKSSYDSPLSPGYASGGSRSSSSGSVYGSGSHGPLKSDGTPDMRYAANKSVYGSSSSYGGSSYSSRSSSSGSSYGGSSSCGPLKSDGTPDMRYAANKSAYGTSSSYGGSSYSSTSSSSGSGFGGSSSCGPLKSNGTPDMRYAANRR